MDLFGTAGIRGDVADRVTPELALAVGRAAGRDGEEFVLGRDGRTTGPALAAAVEAGLESVGARVVRVGRVPTPALAFASRGRRGIMVTASHNPPTDNGLKLFHDGREYDREAENRIRDRLEPDSPHRTGAGTGHSQSAAPVRWDEWGTTERADPLSEYRKAVVAYASEMGAPLGGLRIAVDCGNGTAALATPEVLDALGAAVVAVNANVDGHFPGRDPKPTPESLSEFRAFLGDEFDLGIAHDGDGDRVVVLDGSGEIVHEDTVVAVLAERFVRASDAADPVVVTTPNASARIDERVAAAGGRVERIHLGALHEGIDNAREAGAEGTSVVYAAEPWKHVHPQLGPWIDGVATAAVMARLVAAEGLAALRSPVQERPYRKESVECPDDRKDGAMEELESNLPDAFPDAEHSTDHGIRLSWPDGSWLLVRPSGTEPYIRVYAESDDVDPLAERAVGVVRDAVDTPDQ